MPLLRTEVHEGLVCRFYDGVVVMVGTTAADRFTIRLKDGEDFPTRLKKELEERSAREPKHEGRQLHRKRPTAEEELQGISAKNQKIYDERLAARQAATERNAEDRRAARTADGLASGGGSGGAARADARTPAASAKRGVGQRETTTTKNKGGEEQPQNDRKPRTLKTNRQGKRGREVMAMMGMIEHNIKSTARRVLELVSR